MPDDLRSCVLDNDNNVLKCVEPDGSIVEYDMTIRPSSRSMEIKKNAIDMLLQKGKSCFDSGKCKDSIDATVFTLDSCGHCAAHSSVLNNVERLFKEASIPITITKKNARENLNEFNDLKCNGAPCVAVKKGERNVKLYEGNKGEVGVIADLLGLQNPLFKKRK